MFASLCYETGGVLLIGEEYEQARVLLALLVSINFLAMQLIVKPFRRCVCIDGTAKVVTDGVVGAE